MANIGRRCAKEVSEVCIPDQNLPPFTILESAEAVGPGITVVFGLKVERGMKRQSIARSGNAGFGNRRFSNEYLRPAESQVNYKYVQMDVEALNDGLSPKFIDLWVGSLSIAAVVVALESARECQHSEPPGLGLIQVVNPGCTAKNGHSTTAKEEWSTDPYGRTMLHAPLEGDPSLDPPRSSGDTCSVWIGSSVEEQGPPAPRLASAAGGTPITAPHVPAPPRRGSERCGARDSSKDHRLSIGAAGSATIGTSGEIKIRPRRPS
ncbi:hypothetical protein THAOC_33010 [Thalassiosira oceanica]|uniref:Uncharacterized protein n=1 Tax=Thalassiosira oceanica TaxID=159749 RepID=K0R825_THAOC|nr:hypothetical protein THAOC_33010 [Thalassiosira oceanica]|eukprot:EJK48214.1 hypothetical protein THAOC_33010 [Thalassiosira oceanica]